MKSILPLLAVGAVAVFAIGSRKKKTNGTAQTPASGGVEEPPPPPSSGGGGGTKKLPPKNGGSGSSIQDDGDDDIREAQELLTLAGYPLTVNGKDSQEFREALARFQEEFFLRETRNLDADTMAVLRARRRSNFDMDVLATQRALRELGYPMGTLDGIMGNNTMASLRGFRDDWNEGDFGAQTIELGTSPDLTDRDIDALHSALEKKSASLGDIFRQIIGF